MLNNIRWAIIDEAGTVIGSLYNTRAKAELALEGLERDHPSIVAGLTVEEMMIVKKDEWHGRD